MNRTALSVVALAVGSILILGLYNIYKPQTNSMVHDVFNKVHMSRMAGEKVSLEDQAKDHGININNPKRPKGMKQFEIRTDNYFGGHDVLLYPNYDWQWHKQVKNGYIGYWSTKYLGRGTMEDSYDYDYLGPSAINPQGVQSYERPDGTVTVTNW